VKSAMAAMIYDIMISNIIPVRTDFSGLLSVCSREAVTANSVYSLC